MQKTGVRFKDVALIEQFTMWNDCDIWFTKVSLTTAKDCMDKEIEIGEEAIVYVQLEDITGG